MKQLAWLALCVAASALAQPEPRKSGFAFMSPQTQAIQQDDAQNPGMLWVQEGAALWAASAHGEKSCANCHGKAEESMRGVAARYPAFDARIKAPVNLAQRINLCRTRHQAAPAFVLEGRELLALESFVALQSRGMPLAPSQDQTLAVQRARGQALYTARIGQLDLSCAQCHDARAGLRLAGNVIPQAQVGNYPGYRLEWQSVGSLQRRLRNCMTGVRAQPYAFGAPELVELELYLAQRSVGMPMEAPSVRP